MQRTIYNPLFRDTVTFLQTTRETKGACSTLQVSLMPGGANPPHFHTLFEETFTAVKGQLGLRLGRRTKLLAPGDTYTVQKGEVHRFFNPGREEILFTIVFTPGHEGMEHMLRIVYGMAEDGLTNKKGIPKSLLVSALVMDMSNTYLTGPMSLLQPFLAFLARRARKKGIEKALLDKYGR